MDTAAEPTNAYFRAGKTSSIKIQELRCSREKNPGSQGMCQPFAQSDPLERMGRPVQLLAQTTAHKHHKPVHHTITLPSSLLQYLDDNRL